MHYPARSHRFHPIDADKCGAIPICRHNTSKKKRGVDWTSGDIDDIGGLDSVINGDLGVERDADGKIIPGARAIYVVGSVLRAVGESGEVLAFPPLHIHHVHVNNGPQDNYFDHFPFVEMHGDSGA